jgi:hypothetical protein
MSEEEIARLREHVTEFEDIVRQARSAQHADLPSEVAESFLSHDPVLAWQLLNLMDGYQASTAYPIALLPGVMDRLIDTKLQLHFVTQVWPGTMNLMIYLRGFEEANPLAIPSLQLARLGYSQAMIGAVRLLWERLMRCIHYLETGTDPEGTHTRRVFFRKLPAWSPRWDLLAEFESEIKTYDEGFRTPEYHKGSILKRELLGGAAVDINEVLGLMMPITNGVWTVMMSNVKGEPHNIIRLGRHVVATTPGPSLQRGIKEFKRKKLRDTDQ